MQVISSLLAFFISMGLLMLLCSWIGFRVIPAAKEMFSAIGRGLAFIVHPLFDLITVVGKLLFQLLMFTATSVFGEAKNLVVAKQPTKVKSIKSPIRKDRLCQFKY